MTKDTSQGVDAAFVIQRLEQAGAALLALPGTGWSTRLRTSSVDIVRTAMESYGWTTKRLRPSIPSAVEISRMDEALGWITLWAVNPTQTPRNPQKTWKTES